MLAKYFPIFAKVVLVCNRGFLLEKENFQCTILDIGALKHLNLNKVGIECKYVYQL